MKLTLRNIKKNQNTISISVEAIYGWENKMYGDMIKITMIYYYKGLRINRDKTKIEEVFKRKLVELPYKTKRIL